MEGINVEYINPFLMASKQVLKNTCFIDVTYGKPFVKDASFKSDVYAILIGITGKIGGQVMIAFQNAVACEIAGKMCMTPITQMDEIAISAICELGNMIMGNAATVFSSKGIEIDITPPTVSNGDVNFKYNYAKNVSIPLIYEKKTIELNIALKG